MSEKMTKREKIWVTIFSIAIPIAVAILFKIKIPGIHLSFLPPIYTSMNAATAICLITAFIAVKKGKIILHEKLIKIALVFSIAFLIGYVLYHMTSDSTPYGGKGFMKIIYYPILISHITLSVAVIPLVLLAYLHGKAGRVKRHRKIVKWAFPIWLYVAISGITTYILISPYYT